ncbi:restriction endonuclease [Pseudoxanthomonas sp. Root65]|uniref:restriction endonuclease n=1 Tax=Pseudoxanthomonas sp. Root65 TaxID=1736576 RepID=UPI0009E7C06E|nr:restriction endonuclease [Pseudoxanthomonas sp. Root65]
MPLTLGERAAVAALARSLYGFLPASGNNSTSFPLAATHAGVPEAWPPGKPSKEPGIVALLTWTLENKRNRFCALIQEIVIQAISWRGRSDNPLTRDEVDELNRLLLGVNFRIPELCALSFLDSLSSGAVPTSMTAPRTLSEALYAQLESDLVMLAALDPHSRGYAFERFLTTSFDAFGLAPRGAFRNTGEQIDGSFVLHNETYLVEAKWQNDRTDAADLRAFAGKVRDKATWSRGVFISNSGFTDVGMEAFGRGQPVICVEGLDLYETLQRRIDLADMIARKVRRAVETGRPLARVRELYP